MCPTGLALDHPAAEVLLDYAHGGCPVQSGADWTIEMMTAAIEKGPHKSALDTEAMEQLQTEVVLWDDIKHRPPRNSRCHPLQ